LRNASPQQRKAGGLLEACRRLAGKKITELSYQLPPRDWVPGKRPEGSWENALEGKHDTERTSCLSSSTHSPSFAQQNSHPLPFRQTFPYFMPTY
jgi:hypothetical protein